MSIRSRLLFAFGIGRVSAPSDETGAVQMLQVSHRTGEVHDDVPSVQLFGFASVPQTGCDKVIIYGEGDRSKGVAVASNDQRFRPKGMEPGETQIYDSKTQFIYMQGGQKIVVNAVSEIDFEIAGTLVGKFTAAGLAVTGSITATGNITAGLGGGDQVDLLGHEHSYIPGDGDATNTSRPVAGT